MGGHHSDGGRAPTFRPDRSPSGVRRATRLPVAGIAVREHPGITFSAPGGASSVQRGV
ncbi:MAG: hypothetical protein AVDCRST_MAG19-4227 [uncultured Thermomicrobiales bacterium]|uniref:Uncharacterized protein n=1 Tax=uncultured Thermomicrobiales bacterium TaxID=1645740 RepID=A0A6J4VNF6_9BACT|nr:MAG: hypothetical protein AVDCRST_MAG19-4227 [uncultured Thermomicrobiales bacterium]